VNYNQQHARNTAYNSTYPKGGAWCFNRSFVVNQIIRFQSKFCSEISALRVAAETLYATLGRHNNDETTDRKNITN
jgi:hypothetical protein